MAKPKPPTYSANPAAVASGALAGVSSHFKTAIGELSAVIKRGAMASATDTLTGAQRQRVYDVSLDCQKIIATLESLWRDIDGIVLAGVALPEKKTVEDMFQ